MKEIRDIVAAYDRAVSDGQAAALATVISVEGSSYRQAGARMLISEDGCLTGAISGGCLEGDALKKAQLVMVQGTPKLVRYDTREDDDAQLGFGLGCNGIIDVLIEPLDQLAMPNAISLLRAACGLREPQVIVTHAARRAGEASLGTCILAGGSSVMTIGSGVQDFIAPAKACLAGGSSLSRTGDAVLFFEQLQPELRLLICGAGNDAVPLMQLATVLGWETHVIDGRPGHVRAAQFAAAGRRSIIRHDQVHLIPEPDCRTAAVLMSHNYRYDTAVLRRLMACPIAYIGVLGPRRKLARMMDELGADAECPPPNLFGPAGLDIGASTPEEIALSIVAEIQSVIGGRSGTPLRERRQPIHAR